MSRPVWWQRARDGTWRRWSHRKGDWEPAPGPPPEDAPVTGLLAQAPGDPTPAPRLLTRNQYLLWCLMVAGAIFLGSMAVLWLLSHVWDPFDMRGLGVWRGYRRAFIWIVVLTAAGQAVYVMVGPKRPGRAAPREGGPPGAARAADLVPETPKEALPDGEPERRTAAEWLADPPAPPESDLLTPGEWLRGLARMMAVLCAVFAVATGLLGYACGTQEPSEILGTDPQAASRVGFLMAAGFAVASGLLFWVGRKRP